MRVLSLPVDGDRHTQGPRFIPFPVVRAEVDAVGDRIVEADTVRNGTAVVEHGAHVGPAHLELPAAPVEGDGIRPDVGLGAWCTEQADKSRQAPPGLAHARRYPSSYAELILVERFDSQLRVRVTGCQGHLCHVVPDPEGGWNVGKGGASRATKHFDDKADAVSYGRQVSRIKAPNLSCTNGTTQLSARIPTWVAGVRLEIGSERAFHPIEWMKCFNTHSPASGSPVTFITHVPVARANRRETIVTVRALSKYDSETFRSLSLRAIEDAARSGNPSRGMAEE